MTFLDENEAFESWLRTQCAVVEADLDAKHGLMAGSAFMFLRATCFRWSKTIVRLCPDLADAPRVLSVVDVHIENFGTWRDAEGRLVWGINDFDEVATTPYPFDLVRLAASARLATDIPVSNKDAAGALLRGYANGLEQPRPALLDEQAVWMRPLVNETDVGRERFWKKLRAWPTAEPPSAVKASLLGCLPEGTTLERFAARVAGGGSLGRPRYVAIGLWNGGHVVREAKATVPSSWDWAHGAKKRSSLLMTAARGRYRAPDPHLHVEGGFILRRLAPNARKIELVGRTDTVSARLLEAMAFDIGAIHAADARNAKKIAADLQKRPEDWLRRAAKTAANAVTADYEEWRSSRRR